MHKLRFRGIEALRGPNSCSLYGSLLTSEYLQPRHSRNFSSDGYQFVNGPASSTNRTIPPIRASNDSPRVSASPISLSPRNQSPNQAPPAGWMNVNLSPSPHRRNQSMDSQGERAPQGQSPHETSPSPRRVNSPPNFCLPPSLNIGHIQSKLFALLTSSFAYFLLSSDFSDCTHPVYNSSVKSSQSQSARLLIQHWTMSIISSLSYLGKLFKVYDLKAGNKWWRESQKWECSQHSEANTWKWKVCRLWGQKSGMGIFESWCPHMPQLQWNPQKP